MTLCGLEINDFRFFFLTSHNHTRSQTETHSEHSDESSLQQPHQDVTPVVFIVRDTRVSNVQRERDQEKLDGGSNQSCPLPLHPGVHVELHTQKNPAFCDCQLVNDEWKTDKH